MSASGHTVTSGLAMAASDALPVRVSSSWEVTNTIC